MARVEEVLHALARSGAPIGVPEVAWGRTDSEVDRVVVADAADVELLRDLGNGRGRALVITRTHPLFMPPTGFDRAIVPSRESWEAAMDDDPVVAAKRRLLEGGDPVVVVVPGPYAEAIAEPSRLLADALALGRVREEVGAAVIVDLDEPRPLRVVAEQAARRLGMPHTLVLGDPGAAVGRAAVVAGVVAPEDIRALIGRVAVEAVIAGETVEWEAAPYLQDAISSGIRLALVAVGNIASQRPVTRAIAEALGRAGLGVEVRLADATAPAGAVRMVRAA